MAGEKQSNKKRVFAVLHPRAGHCHPPSVKASLRRVCNKARWDLEIYETTGREDLPDTVRDALSRGCNLIVVAGGDGTVSDVAEALVHMDVPMGILPVGTTNVIAKELWIPVVLQDACELLIGEHRITNMDAMQVDNNYYFHTLSAGLASLMIRDTARKHKRAFGTAAYIWTALMKLLGFQRKKFEVKIDGETHHFRASEVVVANSGLLARRPFRLGLDIRVNDGVLDICVIRAPNIFGALALIVTIATRLQKYDRNITYLKARESVSIKTEEAVLLQADGEIIGETPVDCKVVPKAVKVIVPRTPPRFSFQSTNLRPGMNPYGRYLYPTFRRKKRPLT